MSLGNIVAWADSAALTDAALPKAKEPTFVFRGETVPVSELSEHMRIELMDPRWKEMREAAERRAKETNLGAGTATHARRSVYISTQHCLM